MQVRDGSPTCDADEIHIWRIKLDAKPPELDLLTAVLCAEERTRAGRFATEVLCRRWAAGRGALRMILAAYTGTKAADLVLTADQNGKPRLCGHPASLTFNLSHTGGIAFAALALCVPLGVDAEIQRAEVDWATISRRYFAPSEADEIERLPVALRARAGYACWTRKEAYLKALGVGLYAPLDGFQVTVHPDQPPLLLHVAGQDDEPAEWTLVDLSEPELAVTVAARMRQPRLRRFTFTLAELAS